MAREEKGGQGGGVRGMEKVAQMRGFDVPREMRGLYAAAAGGIAGSSVSFLLHPLDTLKTMSQADKTHRFWQLGMDAVRKHGLYHGLYAGARTAALGSFISSGLYFGTYEAMKENLGKWLPPQSQVLCPSLAAVSGNAVSSLIFVPKEVLKQRCQVGELAAGEKTLGLLARIVQREGVGAMYNGYFATLIRNAPGAMLKFGIFEQIKTALQGGLRRPLKPEELLATGLTAGCISAIVTTPLDVVKTRIMLGRADANPFRAMVAIARHEGAAVLWSGLVPRLLWSATFFAVGISTYELALTQVLQAAHGAPPAAGEPVHGAVLRSVQSGIDAVTSIPDRLQQVVPRLLQTT